ncbi:MAG: DNA topoisomerase 3 [Lachnospiraceae bacterium]|nr:DNA topoisomerase 3 [Lachnospiraceae bacterium]
MQLVITEKPSVARAIAQVLGASDKRDGYFEGSGWLVGWCVGHLVELATADAYDPRYSKWTYADLPIVPSEWQYRVLPDTRKQFDLLRQLMGRDNVDTVICATDAGREGELIFRLVYDLCGCTKPVKRLWISSMEEPTIRKGFENLLDSADYDNLYAAALCRAKADWLVGINGTRLFSTLYKGQTLNVGRVLTPTLALLMEREAAINNFKKEKFYTVELKLAGLTAISGRIKSKTEAEKLRKACLGTSATVRLLERKERAEQPPALYDLTTLQREANRLFGYTAQESLDYLQSLYEKRLATYPRTDSRYLTEDMAAGLPALCRTVAGALPFLEGLPLPVNADQVTDSSKVTDHHAVIPTAEIAGADLVSLPTGERNVLTMLAARLLCAVDEPHIYAETAVTLECGGGSFTAKGRTEAAMGWKEAERACLASLKKAPKGEPPAALPELAEGQTLEGGDAVLKSGTTSPPARFSEDTLLLAMERASAEDFAKLEDVERKGLGTPATRAAIIEKLVRSGYAAREGRHLVPTEKGLALAWAMPDQLKSAKLTAEWEERLGAVERGELAPEEFMAGIVEMLRGLVRSYANVSVASSALSRSGRTVVGKCPRCGKDVVEGKKSFFCEGYYDTPPCGFALWKNNRFFASKRKELTRKIAAALLRDGRAHVTNLFSERKGVFYDATVVMVDDGGKYVRFELEFDKRKGAK